MHTTTELGAGTAVGRTGPARWTLPSFPIPLALAGLGGGSWATATQLLGAPQAPHEVAYAAAAIIWLTIPFDHTAYTYPQHLFTH